MIKLDIRDMTKDEWRAVRKKFIGGSDIAAIVGLNRWCSPIDVWLDKTGRKDDIPQNEAMRQGLDLESYVADRFCEATGKKVRRVNFMLINEDYPLFAANIDREVVGEDALLECKTTSVYSADRWKDGKTPEEYYCQVQWYLGITGKQMAYLACIIFNRDFLIREIGRDQEVIDALFKVGGAFLEENILTDTMPTPDGSDAAGEALKYLYIDSVQDKAISLYGFSDALKRYKELSALKGDMETELEGIKQEIQVALGEAQAEIGFCEDTKITWKTIAGRRTIDAKKLAKEQPETFEKYSIVGKPYKRFTINFADEAEK